jgi:hypothetical protein
MAMQNMPRQTDVHLRRGPTGAAEADVLHLVQHSPTGFEWGYDGSGPADLALSILGKFVPPAGPDDRIMLTDGAFCSRFAWKHHHAFKIDFIAGMRQGGGVIRAADVQQWIAARRSRG